MRNGILITLVLVAVGCTGLFSGERLEKDKLPRTEQGIYAAMRAGFLIGSCGGNEDNLQQLFAKVNAGDTNAIQVWLNASATNCPPLMRKAMQVGWQARDVGLSFEQLLAMYAATAGDMNPSH